MGGYQFFFDKPKAGGLQVPLGVGAVFLTETARIRNHNNVYTFKGVPRRPCHISHISEQYSYYKRFCEYDQYF